MSGCKLFQAVKYNPINNKLQHITISVMIAWLGCYFLTKTNQTLFVAH